MRAVPGPPAARLAEKLATADDAGGTARLQADLTEAPAEARKHRPAPRPAPVRRGSGAGAGRATGPAAPHGLVTYRARNRPSWTTDTSRRPSTS
ncbi:hypothetical protein GCM10010421_36190 [Streptomyces glaucus]|uniref:Secreted protein n=1 Tax=Streptomyces glaucus TaxID=284029 RepID=A0ABN3JW57_9ACTN